VVYHLLEFRLGAKTTLTPVTLVYVELHDTMIDAITREKQLKKWNRAWKVRLIEEKNPNWVDLYETLL